MKRADTRGPLRLPPRACTIGALVFLAFFLFIAGPARAGGGIRGGKVGIGDSVMLGAASDLRARGYRVDAVVSRQFTSGVGLVKELASTRRLPRKVVVHLGNNGTVLRTACDRLARVVTPERGLWLVTLKVPRSWRASNNRILRACAKRHDHVRLIPWSAYAHHHRSWFAADGYHLTPIGRVRYARLIDGYVRR